MEQTTEQDTKKEVMKGEEGKAVPQIKEAKKQQPALPQETPQKRLKKLKPTTVTPKDVIPMDDGDFKDF